MTTSNNGTTTPIRTQSDTDRAVALSGAALAITGIAHLVVPVLFKAPTSLLFPDDPAKAVRINGTSETLVGTAIAIGSTRGVGFCALGVYCAYLVASTARTLRRRRCSIGDR